MVSQTLFLTAGMPGPLMQLEKVQDDRNINSIHIVDYDFGRNQESEEVGHCLLNLLHFGERQWKIIKLAHCRGKIVHQLVEAAVVASNVQRLILGTTSHTVRSCVVSLARGLSLPSSSLSALTLHGVRFNHSLMNLLTASLSRNASLVDLSFVGCRFTQEDSSHLVLGNVLGKMKGLQHLSFSGCRLEDEQCHDLVLSLMEMPSLVELNLDGNRCQCLGMKALSIMLPQSSLLVLDLSSQKISVGSMDLTRLEHGLQHSRLRSLQLSGNVFDEASLESICTTLINNRCLRILHMAWCPLTETAMKSLANALRRNQSLKKLVLYGCQVDNSGLARFSHRMRQMKGLRQLDLGGSQVFDAVGLYSLVAAVQRNTDVTEIILPTMSSDRVYMEELRHIGLLCDANRAGRRFLKESENAPIALWPKLLGNVHRLDLPCLVDGVEFPSIQAAAPIVEEEDHNDDDDDAMSIDGEENETKEYYGSDEESMAGPVDLGARRRASVLYYLLRNGPLLHL